MEGSDTYDEHKLDKVIKMTEDNQREIRSIAEVTQEQAGMIAEQSKMIDKQAKMIDKMWEQVQPILVQHRKRQYRWNSISERFITGAAWGVATGLLFLVYRGAMWLIHNDGGNG